MEWLENNKTWIFSGAGVSVLGGLFTIIYRLIKSKGKKENTNNGGTINQAIGANIKSRKEVVIKRNKQKIDL